MLRLVSGRFGPYCEICAKKAAQKVAGNVPKPALTGSVVPSRSFPNSGPGSNLLIVRQFSSRQKCVRTLFVQVPNITRPLKIGSPYTPLVINYNPVRSYGGSTSKLMRSVGRFLKFRYLLMTGAVGGGVIANRTIDNWRQYIPDVEWMRDYLPKPETLERYRDMSTRVSTRVTERLKTIKLPALPNTAWIKDRLPDVKELGEWMDQNKKIDITSMFGEGGFALTGGKDSSDTNIANTVLPQVGVPFSSGAAESPKAERARKDSMNEEIMKMQTKYQREVDRLEKENKDLRKQLNLMEQKTGRKRKMNKSLIDMYSEILDVLAEFDSSYNTQDHLPRVVVVGDQSAGKTSVLEMVARARIFPRGSGEMMTRAPVKVTLSEGPFHVAQFKDSSREFDLSKDSETEALRREVEVRMKKSVMKGQTVSSECISMSVKGPGIQRMVLVDLPGIISTETTTMAPNTKEGIKKLVRSYMENPNAIILCIQDGSLDAERSNVTDVVSQIDPTGKRTIFVLTKVDLAESNLYNPNRIKSILEGKLFPMKALGYFAVVTGKGNTNDSIESIREYEDQFFRKSRLLKDGALKPTQMNTQNLSMAVSELFWKMVKDNIEQQADAFKATRFNLETEWKNNFPRLRELDREELFEKAKGEILDEVINISLVTPKMWENLFHRKLWDRTCTHVFENIYLPAAQAESVGEFNTVIDIKLTEWANHALPKKSVEVGWDVLHEEFSRLVEKDKKKSGTSPEHDEVFNKLKMTVIEASKQTHNWDGKAEDSLRVIQRNTLEDRSVHDKQHWDASIAFMEKTLKEQLQRNEETLRELTGPGSWDQWRHWQSKTQEHKSRIAAQHELEKLLKPQTRHKPSLSQDELTTVRQTLQSQGIEVDAEFIKHTWYHVFRQRFIKRALQECNDCKKGFYLYQNAISNSGLDCHNVVLFWRLQRMLEVTSNALRQQVMNNEARRLERIIKDVLDEFSEDSDGLKKLLTGRPVELAEELKTVRQIQEKLEEFIEALNREK